MDYNTKSDYELQLEEDQLVELDFMDFIASSHGETFTVPVNITETGNYSYSFVPGKTAFVRLKDSDGNVLVSANSQNGIYYKGFMNKGQYTVEVTYTGTKPTYQQELKKVKIIDIKTLLEDITSAPYAYYTNQWLPDFSATIGRKPIFWVDMKAISVKIEASDTIKVNGEITLTISGISFLLNLSGDNALYIYTDNFKRMTGCDAVLTASVTVKRQDGRCNLFRLGGSGIKSVGLELSANTIENTFSLKGEIALRIACGRSCDFSCTVGWKNGKWDNISISGNSLNRLLLPQYQLYLQNIGAKAENISQGVNEATFGANIGFTVGPKIVFDNECPLLGIKAQTTFSALAIDFDGEWKTNGYLAGGVSVTVLSGIINGEGRFRIDEEGVSLNASLSISIGGASITGKGSISTKGITISVSRTNDTSLFSGKFFSNKKMENMIGTTHNH